MSDIVKDLWKQTRNASPDLETCQDLVKDLKRGTKLQRAGYNSFTKTMQACTKAFRLAKRNDSNHATQWQQLLNDIANLEKRFSMAAAASDSSCSSDEDANITKGLPQSVKAYEARLKAQKKEMYKKPPVMPPGPITVEANYVPDSPNRNKQGRLVFVCGNDKTLDKALRDFHPNRSPAQILQGGAFGGTYFRTITSAVTNVRYDGKQALRDSVPDDWIQGLSVNKHLTSQTYDQTINKYGAFCGGSLGMWESSGWISEIDPYGWFQWYCRFYQGRRCSDDARQIGRWARLAGPTGRFRSQLCNKVIQANRSADDATISPAIRQTLWHWGLEITDDVIAEHKKRKGL